MNIDNSELKLPSRIALIAMGVLLLAGIVFYKERSLFADAAYVLYSIINNHSLAIQEHRYGSFITQMVPLLGLKLHLPVKYLVIGYAVSFNLFYFLVTTLLVFRFRQYGLAILMALYYVELVTDSWFWISNEIQQAVAWMFLFLGFMIYCGIKGTSKPLFYSGFIVLGFLTIFTHFIVIIPLFFLGVYLWLDKKYWPFSSVNSMVLGSILIAMIGLKYAFSVYNHSYDNYQLRELMHISLKDIFLSFSTPVVTVFLHRCLTIYWPVIIILILGFVSLIKKRDWKLVAWVSFSCLGYLGIMGLIYGSDSGLTQLFHIESEWQCLGIIACTPFVFSFLPGRKVRFSVFAIALVFLVRLCYIGSSASMFTWRIHLQEKILAQMKRKGINKLVLYDDSPEIRNKIILDWGASYESLIASAMDMDSPQPIYSFINRNDKAAIQALAPGNFHTLFGAVSASSLNHEYFNTDTVRSAAVMSYEEFLKD